MPNYHIAVTIEENGKYYSYAVKYSQSSNIKSVLEGIKNLLWANVYSTKKRACEVVENWNEGYRKNGTHLFDNAPDRLPF